MRSFHQNTHESITASTELLGLSQMPSECQISPCGRSRAVATGGWHGGVPPWTAHIPAPPSPKASQPGQLRGRGGSSGAIQATLPRFRASGGGAVVQSKPCVTIGGGAIPAKTGGQPLTFSRGEERGVYTPPQRNLWLQGWAGGLLVVPLQALRDWFAPHRSPSSEASELALTLECHCNAHHTMLWLFCLSHRMTTWKNEIHQLKESALKPSQKTAPPPELF